MLWLPLELDVDAGPPLPCPPEEVVPPPEEPILWLGLEGCPLSELIECELDELDEVETVGEAEILGELAPALDGVEAGDEPWVVEAEGLEGMLGECCARSVIDTTSKLGVTR